MFATDPSLDRRETASLSTVVGTGLRVKSHGRSKFTYALRVAQLFTGFQVVTMSLKHLSMSEQHAETSCRASYKHVLITYYASRWHGLLSPPQIHPTSRPPTKPLASAPVVQATER